MTITAEFFCTAAARPSGDDMKTIINRIFCTTPAGGGQRVRGCTTIKTLSSYTGRTVWTPPPRRVAANDNAPARPVVRREGDGPSPEWLAARDAAGTATGSGKAGTRIGRAIARENKESARLLSAALELMRPADVAANDNEPSDNSGIGLETVQRDRPSRGEMRRAIAEGMRPRVITRRDGTTLRFAGGISARGDCLEIGGSIGGLFFGLRYVNGALVAYGDTTGKMRRPWIDATRATKAHVDPDSATAAHLADGPSVAERYLSLRGTRLPIGAHWPDAPRALPSEATPRAIAAQAILDAAWSRTDPAEVRWGFCAPGIAATYGLLSGVSDLKGTGAGKTTAPQHQTLAEIDRADAGDDLRARLSEKAVRVLEAVATGEAYRTIGIAEGYAEKSAHVSGKRAVQNAMAEIKSAMAA